MKPAESVAVSARERTAALVLLGAVTLLRVPTVLNYRVNSDEPQHLHVVWGWTRGLLQYRDVADNHPPLFHALMAPLLALVGERPDAVTVMRFAMLPLALAAVWLTAVIGARLWGRRVALWSAVLLAFHYEFFFNSVEFRTDNLWTVGWLAGLAVVAGGTLGAVRALAAGAALGITLCVSQKTALMLLATAVAAGLVVALSERAVRAALGRRAVRLAAFAAAGFVAAPLAVWTYFAARGAGPALVYGVLTHNMLAGLGNWQDLWRPAVLPVGVAVAAWLAAPRVRAARGDRVRTLRVFLALCAAVYALALETVWPLVTGQDLLPLFPLLAILVARALETWEEHVRRRAPAGAPAPAAPAAVLALLLAAEATVIVFKGPIWENRANGQTSLVAQALALTGRDDPVMDTKGETVFRRRPFFWALETITAERLRRGLLPDTVAEDVVRARCFVAAADNPRFPARGRAFLNRNFISVGRLRVAGRLLEPGGGAGANSRFEIAVPGPYAVVTPEGAAAGTLDGSAYSGPRALAAGPHEFVPARGSGQLAVVWAHAVERGFSPFAHRRDEP